jgi:hypothetical protein
MHEGECRLSCLVCSLRNRRGFARELEAVAWVRDIQTAYGKLPNRNRLRIEHHFILVPVIGMGRLRCG